MYDTVRSSYNLGPELTECELQTKDLDLLMEDYWISPAGELFTINYARTADLVPDPECKRQFWPYKWEPNGNHGRVTPSLHTGDVRLYRGIGVDGFAEITVTFLRGRIYGLSTVERGYYDLTTE